MWDKERTRKEGRLKCIEKEKHGKLECTREEGFYGRVGEVLESRGEGDYG